MYFLLYALLRWVFYTLLTLFTVAVVYAVSGLAKLMVRQHFSHLGELRCPPTPSFFWGHLQLLLDAEESDLYLNWMEQLGSSTFTYRGFIGGHRLVTMDFSAINHFLSRSSDYPKPSFVRDNLASMGGEEGLLVVEGEKHRRLRKILSPSFTAPQVRELAPIMYDKAAKLRDIWLTLVDTAPATASGPTVPTVRPPPPKNPRKPSHKTLLSPATPSLPLTPPPKPPCSPPTTLRARNKTKKQPHSPSDGSAFARAQSLPPRPPTAEGIPVTEKVHEGGAHHPSNHETCESPDEIISSGRVRIDVLNWLGRATLDVIGVAGFGYRFDALVDDQNVLASAFAEIFAAARKFRFMTVLQAWFPILLHFRSNQKTLENSLRTMHRIGMDLIRGAQERLAHSEDASGEIDFRGLEQKHIGGEDHVLLGDKGEGALKGRDLLSLLIKSNIAWSARERMSQSEILCQISTFMAAGHETTSSALTWTLYALAQHPACQSRLRAELSAVPTSTPSTEVLNSLPYLDMVIRESLRLFPPVSQTMREALKDDIVPVAAPYCDAKGGTRNEIIIKKGDILVLPVQAMNKSKKIFGETAGKFIPERWEHPPEKAMPTLYSSMLTFLSGNRSCIGYRFALLEMKVFLFVLIRGMYFEMCPGVVIQKRQNIITRPIVKSEPDGGNQMPLLVSRVSATPLPSSSPPPHSFTSSPSPPSP